MELPQDIDSSKTAKKTRLFLERDFQHYIQMAGVHRSDLKSPTLSFEPKGSIVGNSAERQIVDEMDASEIVHCVVMTIRNCSSAPSRPSQQILIACYLSEFGNVKVSRELGYSKAQYHHLKRIALSEFADRFDYWKNRFGLDSLPDLHEYKERI